MSHYVNPLTGKVEIVPRRVRELENQYLYYEVYQSISSSTGTISKAANATILLDRYENAGDALVVKTDTFNRPVDEAVKNEFGQTVIVSSFDVDGNFVLSGIPDEYPVALVYQIKIPTRYSNNVEQNSIVNSFFGSFIDYPLVTNNDNVKIGDNLQSIGSKLLAIQNKLPFINVKSLGAVGSGLVDDTAAIQAALNASTNVYFPSGIYLCSNLIVVNDKTTIWGDGRSSYLQFLSTSTGFLLDCQDKEVYIKDIRFYGASAITQRTVAASAKDRSGISVASQKRSLLQNVAIEGFENIGLKANDSSNVYGSEFLVTGCYFRGNWIGIMAGDYCEYTRFTNLRMMRNRTAIYSKSGNQSITNSLITDNYYGIYVDGNIYNNGHSNCNNNLINHNDYTIYAKDVTYGYTFLGNQMFDGIIHLNNCAGIKISEGTLAVTAIILEGGGKNWIHGNRLRTSYGLAVTHNYNGTTDYTQIFDNYAEGTTVIDDFFLSQKFPLAKMGSNTNVYILLATVNRVNVRIVGEILGTRNTNSSLNHSMKLGIQFATNNTGLASGRLEYEGDSYYSRFFEASFVQVDYQSQSYVAVKLTQVGIGYSGMDGILEYYGIRDNATLLVVAAASITNEVAFVGNTLGYKHIPYGDLKVNANVVAGGFKSGGAVGQTTVQTLITAVRLDAGVLQYKTKQLTYTSGLITAIGAETDWINS